MKARLLGLFLPAALVAVILGGGVEASRSGLIAPGVWIFLWPSIVAFGFLALSAGALLIGVRTWLWPLITGFVVQTVGILLLWADVFESPWELLLYTLVAVGIVLVIMLVVWLVATLRARWLEQKMVGSLGAGKGVDAQQAAEIRKNMLEALRMLKRAGRGRSAIYQLPWFLVIGRSQAGKTVAIKNSGLGLPVRKDWVKGVGGTLTCDWFFTNDLIFLDTPGKWVTEAVDEDGQKTWVELVRLLKRYRGRRPLDGLVVLVPADDLLIKSDKELEEQASNVRVVIDLLHDETRFRFPVYLLVSKCDLVDGFAEFFKGLPPQRRNEILGWSHIDPNRGDPRRLIPQGFQRVLQRLQGYRLEMLARIASTTAARRLFFFGEEFRNLERPLTLFASVLFAADQYHEAPVFRGFYFTSGTQGEGTPLAQAMSQMARTLGIRPSQAKAAGEESTKRGYFLLELFRHLMVGDQGLVSRTAVQWWRWRRDTMFATFLPAGLFAFAFILSFFSFLLNSSTYRNVENRVPQIVRELKRVEPLNGANVLRALDLTDEIRGYHRQMTGVSPLRRFGMRRPGELADHTLEVFRRQFNDFILSPTLQMAEQFATSADNTCTDRTDVFYSVIWLREGHKGEYSDDLRGFGKLWGLEAGEAEEARQKLLQQFTYLKQHASRDGTFLPGMSLAKVAASIAESCKAKGAGSTLETYRKFQDQCGTTANPGEIRQCYGLLQKVLKYQTEDFVRLKNHLDGLRTDLPDLADQEPEADQAWAEIKSIPMPRDDAGKCQIEFNKKIIPAVERYSSQKELIDACHKDCVSQGKRPSLCLKSVKDQTKGLEAQQKKLAASMDDYNTRCEDSLPASFQLNSNTVVRLEEDYRRVECLEQTWVAPPPPVAHEGHALPSTASAPIASVVRPAGLRYYEVPRSAPSGYSIQGWDAEKQKWSEEVEFVKGLPPAQQDQGMSPVRQGIEEYAQGYFRAWKGYLEAVQIRKPGGAIPGWLKGLSESPELGKLLRPAAQAVPAEGSSGGPPFDVFENRMESLRSLRGFVDAQLGEYQSRLGQTAKDLDECTRNSAFLRQYRAQIFAGDHSNGLIRARDWVEDKGGATLAEGSLRKLLLEPLDEAQAYVQSPDLTVKQWESLVALYKRVASRFPFAGEEAEETADLKDIVALLGGQSGLVPVLRDAARNQPISAQARSWLETGAALSGIVFEEGKDDLRKVKVRLTIGDFAYEPAEIGKDFQVSAVQIYLGEGSDFDWKDPDARTKSVSIPLFGDEASTYGFAAATVAERKGALGRAFGKDFKAGEKRFAAKTEGTWAAVKVLEKGLSGQAVEADGSSLNLVYTIEVPYKKEQPGKLKIPVRAEGSGISLLLRCLKGGLERPPASIAGE